MSNHIIDTLRHRSELIRKYELALGVKGDASENFYYREWMQSLQEIDLLLAEIARLELELAQLRGEPLSQLELKFP